MASSPITWYCKDTKGGRMEVWPRILHNVYWTSSTAWNRNLNEMYRRQLGRRWPGGLWFGLPLLLLVKVLKEVLLHLR